MKPRFIQRIPYVLFVGCMLLGTALPALAQTNGQQPAWWVRSPERFGIDQDALAEAYNRAETLDPLNSFLVARHGELVAEQYFRGMTARQQVNIKSASKSVLSALVGIALEEGYLESLDQTLADFFSEYLDEEADSLKRTITLSDLLTMRAGLETTSFYNYGRWVTSPNWVRAVIEQPMVEQPGGDMIYSTGSSHLISAILTRATGRSTLAFGREHLFDPLGLRLTRWDRDPQGIYFGGNSMALSPRELWRFGQLYLDGGRFRGQQLIPKEWVRASTRRYVTKTRHGFDYGYFWWTETFGGYETHFAWGYGGQYVFIVPALDLVVVCTSSLGDRRRNHNERIYDLLESYVLPAVQPIATR